MNTKQVTYNTADTNSFSITVIPAPIFIRVFYMLFIFIAVTGPLMGIVMVARSGSGVKIGNIIFLVLFGLLAFYMLRVLLWNTYGTEEYRIDNSKLHYEANYGFFRDGRKELDLNTLNVDIEEIEENKTGRLVFSDETLAFESSVKVSLNELQELKKWLEERNA